MVLLAETVTERVVTATVELPATSEMAAFDTMELDVSVTCRYRNPFACSEWDRIARVDVCLDAECGERREIVRWITPYWRRGQRRWIMDASPFLGLLQAGGSQTFRVEMGPSWERKTERDARVALRLRTQGGRPLPRGVELAFRGGSFDAEYNSSREPHSFTRPAEASRVELVAIVTGHGQADGNNCAEWCDHRHQVAVDGTDLPLIAADLAVLGKTRGCAPRTRQGVPPGQWGNWAPGRAYWCPGLPVDLTRVDLSELLGSGTDSTLTYRASFAGGEPAGGDIALNAYVVWYAEPE